MCASSMSHYTDGETRFSVRVTDRRNGSTRTISAI